jgi:hypothetical protein
VACCSAITSRGVGWTKGSRCTKERSALGRRAGATRFEHLGIGDLAEHAAVVIDHHADGQAAFVDQVRVGDDADRHAGVDHRYRSVDLAEHQLDHRSHGGIAGDRHHLARHHVAGAQRGGHVAHREGAEEGDVRVIDRDQSVLDHLRDAGQEALDALRAIDPVDEDRQPLADVDEAGGVDHARAAESLDASEDARSRRPFPPQEGEDRDVDCLVPVQVSLGDEDAYPLRLPEGSVVAIACLLAKRPATRTSG